MRSNRHAAARDRSVRRARTSPHWNRSLWNPNPVRNAATGAPMHADPEEVGLSTWLERSRQARPLGLDVIEVGVISVTASAAAPLTPDPRQQARFASAFLALTYRALQGGWPGLDLARIGGGLERFIMDLQGKETVGAPILPAATGRVAESLRITMEEAATAFHQGSAFEDELAGRPLESLSMQDLERWFQDRWASRLFMLPGRMALILTSQSDRVRREVEVMAREFAQATWYRHDVAFWTRVASGLPLEEPVVPRLSPTMVQAHAVSTPGRRVLLERCLHDGGRSSLQLITAGRIVQESGALAEIQAESSTLLKQVHERMKVLGGSSRLARLQMDMMRLTPR